MKKIKLFRPHMELRIHVSDEMVKDYKECKELAKAPAEDEKDCETCSWHDSVICDTCGTCACDLVEPEQVLR